MLIQIILSFMLCSQGVFAEAKINKKSTVSAAKKDPLDSKALQKLLKRQVARHKQIVALKTKGLIGEGDDGLLHWKEQKRLPSSLQKKANSIFELENRDRKLLYRYLTEKSGDGAKAEAVIRQSLFESYLKQDPAGVSYLKDNTWKRKAP